MIQAVGTYVHQTPEENWLVAESRVTLDSLVSLDRDGHSPEMIQDEFPTLTLETIHRAIAFLRNQEEIDRFMSRQEAAWGRLRQESEQQHRPILQRLRLERTCRREIG